VEITSGAEFEEQATPSPENDPWNLPPRPAFSSAPRGVDSSACDIQDEAHLSERTGRALHRVLS